MRRRVHALDARVVRDDDEACGALSRGVPLALISRRVALGRRPPRALRAPASRCARPPRAALAAVHALGSAACIVSLICACFIMKLISFLAAAFFALLLAGLALPIIAALLARSSYSSLNIR